MHGIVSDIFLCFLFSSLKFSSYNSSQNRRITLSLAKDFILWCFRLMIDPNYPIFIHVGEHLYIPKWLFLASSTDIGSSFWLETHPQWRTDRFGMWILQLWHIDFEVSLASLQFPQREAFQCLNIEMVKLFLLASAFLYFRFPQSSPLLVHNSV